MLWWGNIEEGSYIEELVLIMPTKIAKMQSKHDKDAMSTKMNRAAKMMPLLKQLAVPSTTLTVYSN